MAVHSNIDAFFVFPGPDSSAGIKGFATLFGIPFVFVQTLVIFRVHDGVFTLSERYQPKGVAIVDTAVEQHQNH